MIELGLSHSQMEVFEDALQATRQRRRIVIGIFDANEKRIDTIEDPENMVLEGSIQVDVTAAVTRSLSLTVTNSRRKLGFDVGAPSRGAVYANRFIGVKHSIWVDDFDDWVDVPTFFGPVTGYEQNGDEVTIEAQGKESLMLEPHFATEGYQVEKKTTMEAAIKHIGRKAGEAKFDVDEFGHKLDKDVVVSEHSEPWKILAGSTRDPLTGGSKGLVGWGETGRIMFYDGRGYLNARRLSTNNVYTFTDKIMVSEPTYTFDMLAFRNHVRGKGVDPKGKGKKPVAIAVSLQKNHPLSPESLARNDKNRYLTEFIDAKSIKKEDELRERLQETLEEKSTTGIAASFESIVIPHLEEGDRVRMSDDKNSVSFPLLQFTIPLDQRRAHDHRREPEDQADVEEEAAQAGLVARHMIGRVTQVAERILGSPITANVASADTDLTVDDTLDLEAEGSLSINGDAPLTYRVDDDTTVLLDSTAGDDYTVGDDPLWAYQYPITPIRFAHVQFIDQDEAVEVRVPFALWDKLPVGTREDGITDETVLCENIDGEVSIVDIIGTEPIIDGALIDPDTLPDPPPPALTDGSPPAVSPAAIVDEGIGFLVARWVPISNADPVTYEIYVGLSSGFVADTSTYVGEVAGSMFFIYTDADGDPLVDGTTYYVRIRARDYDGVAAAGTEGSGIAETILYSDLETDGSPPASTPMPLVEAGIGIISVHWSPVVNPDPVTYEVHISTTNGFTPNPGTKHGETMATSYVMRSTAGGTPLANATWYYLKLIAKDADGAAPAAGNPSVQLTQLPFTDLTGQLAPSQLGVSIGGSNLLPDSSFESGVALASLYQNGGTGATLTSDATQSRSGAKSAKITAGTSNGDIGVVLPGTISSGPKVVPGDKLTVSGYAKAAGATPRNGWAIIVWWTSGGSFIGSVGGTSVSVTSAWTRMSVTATAPATAAYATCYTTVNAPGNGESFYVDDMQAELGDVVTAYAPKIGEILVGTITSDKIVTLASDKLTGQLAAAQLAVSIGGGNLLSNTNAERPDGSVTPWQAGFGASVATSADTAKFGAKSFKLTQGGASSGGYLYGNTASNFVQGEKVVGSAWVRTTSSRGVILGIQEYNAAGGYLGSAAASAVVVPANTWTRLIFTATLAQATVAKIDVYVQEQGAAAAEVMYIDGIQLERGDMATAYAPMPDEILPGSIGATQIADDGVTAPKILAGAVVAGKINTDAVTAGTIATNAVTAAKIAAGAVTTQKLLVTSPTFAVNPDPNLQDQTAWTGGTFQTVTDAPMGNNTIRNVVGTGTSSAGMQSIPIDPNRTYRIRTIARKVGTVTGTFYGGVMLLDSAGANITGDGTYWFYSPSNVAGSTSWTTYEGFFGVGTAKTFPSNARTMRPLVLMNSGGAGTGYFEVNFIGIEEVIPGVLIQDGAVTAAKIQAHTITATEIFGGSITATELATDSVTSAKIQAGAVKADEIEADAVVSDKIKANNVLAGHILSGEITTDKLEAVLTLSTKILAGDEASQHVEISGDGLKLKDNTGYDLVSLSTINGEPAIFRGLIESNAITANGPLTLNDANNRLAIGSGLGLASGLGDPTIPPTASLYWPTKSLSGGAGQTTSQPGAMLFTPNGGSASGTPSYVTARWGTDGNLWIEEYDASTGAKSRTVCNMTFSFSSGAKVIGFARHANSGTPCYYVLSAPIFGLSAITVIKQSDGSLVSSGNFPAGLPSGYSGTDPNFTAALGADATNVLLIAHSTTSSSNLKITKLNPSTLADAGGAVTTSGYTFTQAANARIKGIVDDGTYWRVAYESGAYGLGLVQAINKSTGAAIANTNHLGANGVAHGLAWVAASSTLQSFNMGFNITISDHSAWGDADAAFTSSPKLWVGYQWEDATNHSKLSSQVGVDLSFWRRSFVRISPGGRPSAATKSTIFALMNNSTVPAATATKRQATTTYIDTETGTPITMKNYNSAGAACPDTNTFAVGAAAAIEANTGSGLLPTIELAAQGRRRVPAPAGHRQPGHLAERGRPPP